MDASPPSAEAEIGESIEIILDGNRVEAFLSDNVIVFDPKSPHARIAIRAYAYSLAAAGDIKSARAVLDQVGREG
jgi:hypothetical protein